MEGNMPKILAAEPVYLDRAVALAERLGTSLVREADGGLLLRLDGDGLTLVGDGLELRGDFSKMLPRLRRLSGELLVKAARCRGVEQPTAMDATAGLGEDALLLAAAGFSVTMYEYNPVIAALLGDALERAARDPALAGAVGRMELVEADSLAAMASLTSPPDVILLDPMFPARQKSGLIKKKFQLLQRLELPCAGEEALLRAALAAHPRKVVVKRPKKGPWLGGVKPSYSLEGSTIRYDCLVPPQKP